MPNKGRGFFIIDFDSQENQEQKDVEIWTKWLDYELYYTNWINTTNNCFFNGFQFINTYLRLQLNYISLICY